MRIRNVPEKPTITGEFISIKNSVVASAIFRSIVGLNDFRTRYKITPCIESHPIRSGRRNFRLRFAIVSPLPLKSPRRRGRDFFFRANSTSDFRGSPLRARKPKGRESRDAQKNRRGRRVNSHHGGAEKSLAPPGLPFFPIAGQRESFSYGRPVTGN